MENKQNNYCIILAGGVGRRLWPVSSETQPKQFIDFFGTGRTLLQQTYDRFADIMPESHIFVSTFENYVETVKQQLPQLPLENILPEPVQLNTAPSSIWATWHVVIRDPKANLVVTPADQIILREERFKEQILKGLDYVDSHDTFLAMGVKPTQPNTAYGYIQKGKSLNNADLYAVKSFTEKPELDYAQMFMESGEFLWNTGLFLWKGETMGCFFDHVRGRTTPASVENLAQQMLTIAEEMDYVRSTFPGEVPRSLDLLILEHCENVAVQECDFGWADVGCWPEVHAAMHTDADGNAVSGDSQVIFSGSKDCMVVLPNGMKAVVAGLDNFLVAQKEGMLMICPNTNSDLIRKLINEARMNLF